MSKTKLPPSMIQCLPMATLLQSYAAFCEEMGVKFEDVLDRVFCLSPNKVGEPYFFAYRRDDGKIISPGARAFAKKMGYADGVLRAAIINKQA